MGTSAALGAGRLLVIVPHDAVVRLSARVGAGGYRYTESRVPGWKGGPGDAVVASGGLRLNVDETLRPVDGVTPVGVIDLSLDTSVGLVAVERQAVPDEEPAEETAEETDGEPEGVPGAGAARTPAPGDDGDTTPVAAGAAGRVEVNR
ncbi:hypothetical protein FNX48_022310 [Streptomyces sp. IF17]|nr:hypothetical protein [Streptomyces alkaliphilus]